VLHMESCADSRGDMTHSYVGFDSDHVSARADLKGDMTRSCAGPN